jgi:head-tail adaptor
MAAMHAGKLDRKVIIESPLSTPDPVYGTPVISWVPLVTLPGSPPVAAQLWANVADAPPSRSESVKLGLQVARNQVVVTLRYRADITSAMRITEVDAPQRVLQIVGGPAQIGRRRWSECVCEAIL